HLRLGTSGASVIPDPHHFLFNHNEPTYSLVHNGTLAKEVLLSLLTEENTDSLWINNHAPNTYGNGDWAGEGWEFVVDSDLYFLWIMKNIEENEYNVVAGLTQALSTLNTYIPGCGEKTIIFSDGSSLYLYGAANNLHYTDGSTPLEAPYADVLLHHKAVMTVPPTEGIASYMSWISIEDNQLVVLTDGDVTTSMVEALPSPDSPILPKAINLYQNYPNPFNPTTTIQYELSQETIVKLAIYDLAGREVAVLLDGKQQPGLKNLKWNASSYAGGIYFYRLETPSDQVSGKMVLLK
ncbi:MAG: T9SS type A sorting domain-containing protein, partial [Candidatus Marinimicrobia bacterium]|nr:T9SS type A sorting domain-containing protein [Candidatus Neomarinimicrobiota bacterium]